MGYDHGDETLRDMVLFCLPVYGTVRSHPILREAQWDRFVREKV